MAGKTDEETFRPEWLEFERELGFRPLLHGPTYNDLLQQYANIGLAMVQKYNLPDPDPEVLISDEHTASGIRLKIYIPPNRRAGNPIICYFHGGGCVLGGVDEDDYSVCRYAKDTASIFVSVEYRLAPLNPYPAGFEDCVEAAKWCIDNAEHLKAVPEKVLLMGVSAGATLALATALKLVDEKRKGELQGVVACQPFTLHPDAVPEHFQDRYGSYDEHDRHTINTKAAMMTFLDLHAAPKDDPYIFSARHRHLKELPCVYLCAAECDTLRDDARNLRGMLDEKNVLYSYDEYAKLPHCFHAYPSSRLDGVRNEYFDKTAAGINFVIESSEISPIPLS